MPVLYRCSYCQGAHPKGMLCPKRPVRKKKQVRQSEDFYRSKEWILLRDMVRNRYNFVDIWLLGKTGAVQQVRNGIVHHIEEFQENPQLGLEFDNLIYVSRESHNEIHQYYDTFRKKEALEIIKRGVQRYKEL